MSAIGEYVHLTARGYNEHGITRDGAKETYNYAAEKKRLNERMKVSSFNEKEKLEKALKVIFSPEDKSNVSAEKIRNAIEKTLDESFGKSLGEIDWSTGDVQDVNAASRIASKNVHQIQSEGEKVSVKVKNMISAIRTLEESAREIKDVTTKEFLWKQITEIYRQLNKIIKECNEDIQERGIITILRAGGGKYKNYSIDTTREDTQNLITTVNELIQTYAKTPAINLQKGTLFEYAIALAPIIASGTAEEEVDKVIEEFSKNVMGDDRSNIVINLENSSPEIDFKKITESRYWIVHPASKTLVSTLPSQHKIDVSLQWEDNNSYAVSAKNVKLSRGSIVHILSGGNFLYLLQDENPDFINHFLNIVAAHKDGKIDSSMTLGVFDTMKTILLYKALSGDTFQRQSAELFIVNNNITGEAKIFEVKDLILKAQEDLEKYANLKINDKKIENLKLNNAMAETVSQRITNLIAQVHNMKVDAALKSSILKE